MKKIIAVVLMVLMMFSFTACGKKWTCDWCDTTFSGDAYYGSNQSDTLCADCATKYWSPFPIKNYKK